MTVVIVRYIQTPTLCRQT